ncbi:MAG TPA: D-alanyl-D-alanine carboxypeptidase family protein [Nevskiaceae bacterium]|nr:D-alanyl-D-alanine carboxypeptidase family protein [Nevskiaceae bacterium]
MNARRLLASLLLLPGLALAANIPDPPTIAAKSWVLMDAASGEVLAGNNAEARVEPASITKVMLSYVVYDEIARGRASLEDMVLISEKAWRQGIDSSESRMFLNVGSRVKLEDLLRGIVIQSGNDSSIAMAEHLAGSEQAFAELMNQHAKRLGMKNTHFTNAPGLPDAEHYTTAHDLALLGQALIRDFPDHYPMYAEKEFVYNGIRQANRNYLLGKDPSVDGIKTGHTQAAGYCLLASAQREGRRLISVVMGADSWAYREQATQELLSWGFRFFETVKLFGAETPAGKTVVWKGARPEVAVGTLEPLALTLPRETKDRLEVQTRFDGPAIAPLSRGQTVGQLTVSLDGKTLRELPLVVLEDVPAGSWWRRLIDTLRLWLFG